MSRDRKAERIDERGNERPTISLGEDSAFNLPQSFIEKHPNKSFAFVPYLCGGVELHDTYYDAVHGKKFEPVLGSSFPELVRRVAHSPFKSREDDDLIKVKGQVLMMRDIEIKKAEEQKYDEKIARQKYINDRSKMDARAPYLQMDERKWGNMMI
jgi:hypothetical protein